MLKKYSKNIITSTLTSNLLEDAKSEDLLKSAVYYIDAKDASSSNQIIDNLGTAKELLPTTLGSSSSSDSNDPTYLSWSGTNYYYNPGINYTNYITCSSIAELNITGSIDIRIDAALDSWTSPTNSVFFGKEESISLLQYSFRIDSGYLKFLYRAAGDSGWTATATSTTTVPFTSGQRGWVRVTLDATNRNTTFYTSSNGITWTQLGSIVTGNNTTVTLDTTTAAVTIFGSYFTNASAGKFYRAQVYNGINGTKVLDLDTSLAVPSSNSFKAITGQTFAISRQASGKKAAVVTQPIWLFGTDDYMEVNNKYMSSGNYLYLPGINGNYASIPDANILDITGDLDVRVKVALDDWTPGSANLLLAKWSGSGNYSYYLYINSGGAPSIQWSPNGTDASKSATGAALNLKDGSIKWIRWVLDVDNGAGGNDNKFYTSDDGINWTQLGSTITQSGTTSIYAGTAPLELGSYNNGNTTMTGKLYRAQIFNGINGTLVMDANFETGITSLNQASFTESSTNAATVTVNRSGSTYRSAGITQSGYLYPGSTNTFIPSSINHLSFGLNDSYTLFIVGRQYADPAGYGGWMSKGTNTDTDAWSIFNPATNNNLFSNGAYGPNYTIGQLSIVAATANRSNSTAVTYINSIAGTANTSYTTDTSTNFKTLKIGSFNTGLYSDIEIVAAAVFRRVLTTSEISLLTSYFQRRES